MAMKRGYKGGAGSYFLEAREKSFVLADGSRFTLWPRLHSRTLVKLQEYGRSPTVEWRMFLLAWNYLYIDLIVDAYKAGSPVMVMGLVALQVSKHTNGPDEQAWWKLCIDGFTELVSGGKFSDEEYTQFWWDTFERCLLPYVIDQGHAAVDGMRALPECQKLEMLREFDEAWLAMKASDEESCLATESMLAN